MTVVRRVGHIYRVPCCKWFLWGNSFNPQPCEAPFHRASQVALVVENLPANARDITIAGSIPGSGRFSEEGNGNPEEPGGLRSIGSQEVGHD